MSACKQCSLPVNWKLVDGKWQCFNSDGSVHWDKCSQARFAQIRKEGAHFVSEDGLKEGYRTRKKKSGVQYTRITAVYSTGPKIDHTGCSQCVPPWEVCLKCPNSLVKA